MLLLDCYCYTTKQYTVILIDFKRGGVLYEAGGEKTIAEKWRVELKPIEGQLSVKSKVL